MRVANLRTYSLLSFFLLAIPKPAVAQSTADNLLTVSENCGSQGALDDNFVFGTYWQLTTGYTNVNINIAVTSSNPVGIISQGDGTPIMAFLTSTFLSGATVAGEIAHTSFVIPPGTPPNTLVPVFVGLALGPGNYFLSLYAPTGGYAGGWCVATSAYTVSSGQGVTLEYTYELNGPPQGIYPPASGFLDYWFAAGLSITGQQVMQSPVASQTITFGALSNVTFGVTPFTISATASSGLPVTFNSNTTSVCTVSGGTVTILAAGTCTITASQAGNASYSAATPVAQSFTVTNLAMQAITFGALSNLTLGVAPFTIVATASSGLQVTFASTTPSVCTVSGSTVTILAVGTCSISASQAGNASYGAATPVTQMFAVNSASGECKSVSINLSASNGNVGCLISSIIVHGHSDNHQPQFILDRLHDLPECRNCNTCRRRGNLVFSISASPPRWHPHVLTSHLRAASFLCPNLRRSLRDSWARLCQSNEHYPDSR